MVANRHFMSIQEADLPPDLAVDGPMSSCRHLQHDFRAFSNSGATSYSRTTSLLASTPNRWIRTLFPIIVPRQRGANILADICTGVRDSWKNSLEEGQYARTPFFRQPVYARIIASFASAPSALAVFYAFWRTQILGVRTVKRLYWPAIRLE